MSGLRTKLRAFALWINGPRRNLRRSVALVGVVGLIVGGFLVGRVLAAFDWDPSATIKFGEASTEQNAYGEELLGEIVVAPRSLGHDGKFFFSQAMDPFYLEPDVHAVYLDRPAYRAQRMLYPTLAGLGGLLSPTATAWGLIVVNVVALGMGSAATALVAKEMGLSPWFGLAFALNPGVFIVMWIDSAGILALAALMFGIYFVMRENLTVAAFALVVAALTRETMLIGALGLAAFWYWKHRQLPKFVIAPVLAVAGWWIYLHWRLQEGLTQDTKALGLPFVGFAEAFQRWVSEPERLQDLLMGVVLLAAALGLVVRAVKYPSAFGWAVAGFAVLGIFLSAPVWYRYFDSSRALAPVLTAYLILVPASAVASRKDGDKGRLRPSGKGRDT